MNFAKKILHKYGWKDGDGLGKRQNGIIKPLKAHLKFDKSGLGVDHAASDFNNHWWQRVYNEASNNIQIDKCKDGQVKLHLKDSTEELEITTESYSIKKLKKVKKKFTDTKGQLNNYENFLQAKILVEGGGQEIDNSEKITCEEIALSPIKVLTDEELFAACEGRTAHKGARHGLSLSGKLLRIEKQEKELLSKMLNAKRENENNSMEHKKKHKLSETIAQEETLNFERKKVRVENSSTLINLQTPKKINRKKLNKCE